MADANPTLATNRHFSLLCGYEIAICLTRANRRQVGQGKKRGDVLVRTDTGTAGAAFVATDARIRCDTCCLP